jgi:hypothetical protein
LLKKVHFRGDVRVDAVVSLKRIAEMKSELASELPLRSVRDQTDDHFAHEDDEQDEGVLIVDKKSFN